MEGAADMDSHAPEQFLRINTVEIVITYVIFLVQEQLLNLAHFVFCLWERWLTRPESCVFIFSILSLYCNIFHSESYKYA